MTRRKGKILRRETIIVDGKEIEVDTFDVKVVLGSVKWTPFLGQDRGNVKVGPRYPQGV